jgi:hypothetical protein
MVTEPRRINVTNDRDVLDAVEAFRRDRIPRLLERDGERIALLVDPGEYDDMADIPKSARNKERLMELAGILTDAEADELRRYVDAARHESPPSDPVRVDPVSG